MRPPRPVFAAADRRRPRRVALVAGVVALPVVAIAAAVGLAMWRGPDAPSVHLPAYEHYGVPVRSGTAGLWSSAPASGPPLLAIALLAVAVATTIIVFRSQRQSRWARRSAPDGPVPGGRRERRSVSGRIGRWWGPGILVGLLVLVTALVAHGYTSSAIGRDSAPDDSPAALAIGTGPVLEVRSDGVRSAHAPLGHVALTFDDGPDRRWTPAVLDVLAREHVVGTFFVIGEQVVGHAGMLRRMVREGNEIGVHTYRHLDMSGQDPAVMRRDLRLTQLAIIGATGRGTALFRPPFVTDPKDVNLAQLFALYTASGDGYIDVLADRDSSDWSQPGVASIVRRAMPRFGAGAVIELHDGGGDRSQTVAALGVLIQRLKQHGYQFNTISELARLPAGRVMPSASGLNRLWGSVFLAGMGWAAIIAEGFGLLVIVAALLSLAKVAIVIVGARRGHRRPARPPVAVSSMPSVSVLVAAYDEEDALPGTLRALGELRARSLEIVVVDDGSRDGTANVVAHWADPRVRLVQRPHSGKAAALAAGLERCRGEIVVTIDADTRPDPDALRRIVEPFHDPGVGAVSGNLRVSDGGGWLARAQRLEYVIANSFDRRALDEWQTQVTVPGAIGAFRRGALVGVGGFEPYTVAEDTDLTLGLVAAGYRVRFAPEATASTEAVPTVRGLWRQRSRWSFGIAQAVWRRGALATRWRTDPRAAATWGFAVLAHVALPLAAPLLDVAALWALFRGGTWVLMLWAAVTAAQLVAAAYAIRCEGGRLGMLWAFPLHLFGYRQLTAFVVPQTVIWATAGRRAGWHTARRTARTATNVELPARDGELAPDDVVDLTRVEPGLPVATPVGV